MAEIDAKTVMALRKKTGAPMMDCKRALAEANGDMDKAVDVLRKQGIKAAESRSGREAGEGVVFSYIHHNQRVGVLAEVVCETDFVARNEEFQAFGTDLCLHIASMRPKYLDRESVPAAAIEKERNFVLEQTAEQMKGRPQEVVEKASEGRMNKWFEELCLLEQPYVKDDKKSVSQFTKELAARIGENIQIKRFARFEIGDED